MRPERVTLVALLVLLPLFGSGQDRPIVIGSKSFTESYLLAEIMAQLLEAEGLAVERRFGFAGTRLSFEALVSGAVDLYPEYTGTITETILDSGAAYGSEAFTNELDMLGLQTLAPFGFNNTYALTVTTATAAEHGLERISDLASHPDLRFGLSHEFRDRADGWPGLKEAYALPQSSFGIEHGLAYRAMLEKELDVTDAYSTDADLARYALTVLDDDRSFFPEYLALPLARRDLDERARAAVQRLAARFDAERIRELNAEVAIAGRTFAEVARTFLAAENLAMSARGTDSMTRQLLHNTLVHLKLTGLAVLAACVCGLTLALAVYRSSALSRAVLYVAGLLQTIPSIALLALLIPLAGVGQLPAIIALFLYSLLPIVRNTITALLTVDPLLRKVAAGMGLSEREQLRFVYLPLAVPHLLSGLRIAAVVSIGTATLAAFIGAGGLGEPIVTGLALNDTRLILFGAVPAALLALLVELLFEGLERWLVPAHLMART